MIRMVIEIELPIVESMMMISRSDSVFEGEEKQVVE